MFDRLIKLCAEKGLAFGVKLTNTFPVDVTRGELPSEEMYMSGRSLFPLTIELARRIARQFDGKLRISYSGGADARNIRELYAAGIWPITMATNVLKPGGYERFFQIAGLLAGAARSEDVDVDAVTELAAPAWRPARTTRSPSSRPSRTRSTPSCPLMSCFTAPCRTGCPIQQDIPAYLSRVDEGKFAEALRIIVERNALPHITGNLCPHPCGAKCERAFYEPEGARIREHKLAAARGGFDEVVKALRAAGPTRLASAADKNVAVIGGGPAGLATAFFLTRAGAKVTIIERTDKLGGVARHVIPDFRISHDDIDKDVALCLAFGAQVQMGREVTSVAELFDEGFTDVVVATGAWAPGKVGLKAGEEIDVLEFLEAAKAGEPMELGTDVVIVGAGNTAMDAARVAKRAEGVKNVRIVYRRTKKEMPADEEELQLALEEGVELCELLAPIGVADGKLACEVMRLGAPDESGRRRPEGTGETVQVPATAVICAVGEQIERGLYEGAGVEVDRRGRPAGTATGVDHVWGRRRLPPRSGHLRGGHRRRAGRCPRPGRRRLQQVRREERPRRQARRHHGTQGRRLPRRGRLRHEPLPGLRHRLRGLLRRLPQPRQRGDQGAGPRAGAGRPRGRHVQRVRQLRRVLPVERASLQGQAHALLERRGHGREREPRLPPAVRRHVPRAPGRLRRHLRRERRRLWPARGRAPHHCRGSATATPTCWPSNFVRPAGRGSSRPRVRTPRGGDMDDELKRIWVADEAA